MTAVRLTPTGRAALRAVLDADQLDRAPAGLRAPGWNDVVDLPDEWVEAVAPPLPEPDNGSIVFGKLPDRIAGRVWHRDDGEGHADPVTEPERWWSHDLNRWDSWGDIQAAARTLGLRLTTLVPTPEPVTLPWHLTSINGWGRGTVCLTTDNPEAPIAYGIDDVYRYVTPEQARAMAAALLTAADQAERAS